MGLKVFRTEFEGISKDFFLRSDVDYFEIKNKLNIDNCDKLKKYITFLETGKPIEPADYEEESENVHITVRNIVDGAFEDSSLIYINDEKAEELKNYRLQKNDFVIAISSNCGFSFYYDGRDTRNLTLSHYLARFRVNESLVNPLFLNYYTNSKTIKQYFRSVETGKTLKNLSKYYIKKMPALIPNKLTQDQIVIQIEPIEQKIKELKNQIQPEQTIINKVFAREFGFEENLYNELGKGMTAGTQIAENRKLRVFETDFSEFSKNKIVRFSCRFHNPPTKKLMNVLNSIETVIVKDVVTEPIHRGASPKYDPNGGIPVVKTGHLKNSFIEISQEEFVDADFYNSSIRSQIKQHDVLIASTGKISLGKIDILDDEQDLIADGHVSIIRINKEKCNPHFLTYFFRCVLGYFQIERDFTGATNQIELYADDIANFQIPDIFLDRQQQIVDEIEAKLNEQEKVKQAIAEERNKIDELIENSIDSNSSH